MSVTPDSAPVRPAYIRDAAGLYYRIGGGGGGSDTSSTSFQWVYDNNETMVDPGSGDVRTDTVAGEPSTQIAFSKFTASGIDASRTIAALANGDLISFQETDNASNWGRYKVTSAPTDNGTWWLVPVLSLEMQGVGIAKSQNVLVQFTQNYNEASPPSEIHIQTYVPSVEYENALIWVDSDDTSLDAGAGSTTPASAPVRPTYARNWDGLYYKIGGGGGTPEVYAQTAEPGASAADVLWVDIDDTSISSGSSGSVTGRNRIINGDFSVNQRGFISANATTYGFDRWKATYNSGGGSPSTHAVVAATIGELPESSAACVRIYCPGTGPGSSYTRIGQPIESVRTLSGKTVTVSFWAKAASGTPNIGVSAEQVFGSGGSTAVTTLGGVVVISTTWTRYSVTFAVPSITGKTIGTDHYLYLTLVTSSGTSGFYPAVGMQANTLDIWGVQVEEGSAATSFEQKSYADELRACQRYYYRRVSESTSGVFAMGYLATTTTAMFFVQFPVPMRSSIPTFGSAPAATFSANGAALTAITAPAASISSMGARIDATCQTGTVGTGTSLFAGGSSTTYLDFSAEF